MIIFVVDMIFYIYAENIPSPSTSCHYRSSPFPELWACDAVNKHCTLALQFPYKEHKCWVVYSWCFSAWRPHHGFQALPPVHLIPEGQLCVSFLYQPNFFHSIINFVFIPHMLPELLFHSQDALSRTVVLSLPNAMEYSSLCFDEPNHKTILLPLHNRNFVTVINHNVNIWYGIPKRSYPQVENYCFEILNFIIILQQIEHWQSRVQGSSRFTESCSSCLLNNVNKSQLKSEVWGWACILIVFA